mmetsp:Transcript_48926/g.79598  ORF Transcript_48926/g.79598 Transcript_48926/m.79598 type:complete len:319 (-) Transcript_48926:1448-2404(-)
MVHHIEQGSLEVPARDRNGGLALLQLKAAGVWSAVREHEAVDAEGGIVDGVPEVPTVRPILRPVRRSLGQPLVNPVPHKAPLQSGVHVDRLPVLVHVAVAVAHGMCVLAQDQGPPFTRFRYGLLDLLHPVIHRAQDIRKHGVCHRIPFIVQYARVVQLPDEPRHGCMIGPTAGLVPERPEDDTGVVLVPGHHAAGPLTVSVAPELIVREHGHGVAAVRLDVGLIHDVEPVFVAQFVPQRIVRIMGGSDGVEIVLLQKQDVLNHVLLGDDVAMFRMVLVSVGAPDSEGDPIHMHQVILHLHLADADLAALNVPDLVHLH